jgi:hypothetical protein
VPACADDAHRPLGKQHDLAASLSEVDQRVITNDYTIRHKNKVLQIVREQIRPRMRGSPVRVETRRNGEIAVRFQSRYVQTKECQPALQAVLQASPPTGGKKTDRLGKTPRAKSQWMNGFWDRPAPTLQKAIKISNATS